MEDLIALIPSERTALLVVLGARALLLVLDGLDETYPKLRPFTAVLGQLLGGKKAR